ncbi:alcohol dehydrogenase catalytic domain-containing protein [Microbacterium sp. AK031]|uniref:alcohol dehydrogenase catalytic domain-containing protein n=1 Tax=Microbacterium sp. AK031 TaxID=2723076 RepID=UPI002168768E|nr:alcohol dehydrogenase catalytic domain-containing protein [Microbacterium sp. AK031]MCS3845053.1 threonine dehydrogenase-like Zn-dependent dehydrogenase [Microbacterium sp. AK031]
MTETMTAVVYTGIDTFEVTRLPIPTPGPGELLVRVEAAGLCHTDLDILAGRYAAEFPRIPGHEFAGTVVDAEPELIGHIGTRVAIDPLISCHQCRSCLRGHPNLCTQGQAYGAERDGGFAEYVVVRSANTHHIGRLSMPVAALAEPFACAVNAFERARLAPGATTLIIGAGPMGMILSIAARGWDIHDVTFADRIPERLERARSFGATDTVLVKDTVSEELPPAAFDLVIDATGRPSVLQDAVQLLADGGTLIPFGVCPPGSQLTLDPFEVYRRQLRIIGSFSLNRGIPEALQILQRTRFPIEEMITTRFTLRDGAEALTAIGGPNSIKVQFDPTFDSAPQ